MLTNDGTGSNADAQTVRVAIYARVASDGDSSKLATQVVGLRQYVEEVPNHVVVEVYSDTGDPATERGAPDHRPGYCRLMADAQAARFELVVTPGMKTLAGSVTNVLEAVRDLLGCGVAVRFRHERVSFLRSVDDGMLATLEVDQKQASWWSRHIGRALALVEDTVMSVLLGRSERAG